MFGSRPGLSPASMSSASSLPPPYPGLSGQSSQLAISNGVLLAAVIFLFMVVVFVFLLYLYARRYLGANPRLAGGASSRFLFVSSSPFPARGLDAAVLRELPVTAYRKADFAEPLECAVCLSELADGEKARVLPKCGHGFHVECIDMWFHSHATCPLCRGPVGPEPPDDAAAELPRVPREQAVSGGGAYSPEFPLFPTNVLFWGTQDAVSAAAPVPGEAPAASSSSAPARRKDGHSLVIDIPRRAAEGRPSPLSPLPASRMAGGGEDMRSPVAARLRSLRRLLSRGKQAAGPSSCSPRGGGCDVEQGMAPPDSRPPRTPRTPPAQ